MKVILVNGSPRAKGCTYTALTEVANTLQAEGIETEIVQIGTKAVQGCISCGACHKLKRCVQDEVVNELGEKILAADGMIFGSPVYYANANGSLLALMDRLFFVYGKRFQGKLAASVVSARRGGCTSAFDTMNKFYQINHVHVVSSQYWNQVHGSTPEQVAEDLEGLQIMRSLGRNMAWLLKCIELGKEHGLDTPVHEAGIGTNFIR
ncbi:MAG: flavodoxin family protein [Lachnospiraceae bacterium]